MPELTPTPRLLLGPGPSNVNYRVLRAMSTPLVGHLDPQFLAIMDEVCDLLRQCFQTANPLTFPVSGTGSAGMEAAVVNLIEPGDTCVIGVNGVFGMRMREVAQRAGAEVVSVEAEWGQPLDPEAMIQAVKDNPRAKFCGLVHAETSTGVHQPLKEIGAFLQGTETLFLVDTVTSLAGVELRVDDWGIDVCYSGTQKCLSVPSGLAPITFGPRAMEVITGRKHKVQSWYLDVSLLAKYLGSERLYHHTAPISMNYALLEGLRLVAEEGLEARWERHQVAAAALGDALTPLGFTYFAAEGYRLPQLNTVAPPQGVDVEGVRKRLLSEHNIEVGAGLGAAAGKIWRIGLMGENASLAAVATLVDAVKRLI